MSLQKNLYSSHDPKFFWRVFAGPIMFKVTTFNQDLTVVGLFGVHKFGNTSDFSLGVNTCQDA